MSRKLKEIVIKNIFLFFALLSIVILALIILFLFVEGAPIFGVVSVKEFLFGTEWYPTYDPPEFGIWSLIVGSLIVTIFASILAVPLGV
ncbi:MAG: phosphate ABC transporter permease subunit PstC, partial [Deltaproteobacteria bacterium]|nr:phosphate ABC transporter permease subunit PstC [Deltaproteobacteria bacterium]